MPDDMPARDSATAKTPKPPRFRSKKEAAKAQEPLVHVYHDGAVCETEPRGFPTPENRSRLEIVVDASEGFIPLWEPETILRWRFNEQSMLAFADPDAAKTYVRELFGKGLQLWGDAVPVKFKEAHDAWDFEIAVQGEPSCTPNGCTLARAFFPDAGRHDILLFPTLFEQALDEQVETLAHELGHVFGLRHFFAKLSETAFPAEVFGTETPFSIMNYGPDSKMSDPDRADLKTLYNLVWSGAMTHINGTPIRLTRPFSAMRLPMLAPAVSVAAMPAALALRPVGMPLAIR